MQNTFSLKQVMFLLLSIFLIFTSLISGCFDEGSTDDNILYVNVNGRFDFTTIQQAIDAASFNTKIMVMNGVYYENLIIEKPIILEGESKNNAIIDGNGSDDIIHISNKGIAEISNFTIRNSGIDRTFPHNAGIKIESNGNSIHHNIIANNSYGLMSFNVGDNQIFENLVYSNREYGIFIYQNHNDLIFNNTFEKNDCAIRVKGCINISIYQNIIQNNSKGLQFCCGSNNNEAYHNLFLNNTLWHADDDAGSSNRWNKPFPIGGNYWDDYNGNDNDNDGFGDSPYDVVASEGIKDFKPLIRRLI